MTSKKRFSIFPFYRFDENQKGILRYISFKLLCLSLYIIGFYYVFLNNSLENSSLEISKNCNVYKRNLGQVEKNEESKREKNLKQKNEDVSETESIENNNQSDEQNLEENKHSSNSELSNSNIENECNTSISNINYNDISKKLTEEQLLVVLNSLEKCPPIEDLKNIWTHTIGVAQEIFDNVLKELRSSIQKNFHNDIHKGINNYSNKKILYERIWDEYISRFSLVVGNEEVKYTNEFFSLINNKHKLDDILKFIYSFLENFKIIINKLHKKHEKDLLKRIAQSANKKKKIFL